MYGAGCLSPSDAACNTGRVSFAVLHIFVACFLIVQTLNSAKKDAVLHTERTRSNLRRLFPSRGRIAGAVAGLLLTGCTLSLPQLQPVLGGANASPHEAPAGVAGEYWLLDLGDIGAIVRLYSGGPTGFIFASSDGETLAFDGWVIRSLDGIDGQPKLVVRDSGGVRTYLSSAKSVASETVRCSDWTKATHGKYIAWRQVCEGLSQDNLIELDEGGEVKYIRQAMNSRGVQVTLTKVTN